MAAILKPIGIFKSCLEYKEYILQRFISYFFHDQKNHIYIYISSGCKYFQPLNFFFTYEFFGLGKKSKKIFEVYNPYIPNGFKIFQIVSEK